MIPISILFISIILDGIFTNFLPYLPNDLSWFTPLLTVVSIFIIYPFYRKTPKKYYKTVFVVGIIYDLLYTNLWFLNAVLFLIIACISKYLYKNYEISFIRLILYTCILIISYETIFGGVLFCFQVIPITFEKLIYKIEHSLIMNIIYMEIVYYFLKIIPSKYKKISIN